MQTLVSHPESAHRIRKWCQLPGGEIIFLPLFCIFLAPILNQSLQDSLLHVQVLPSGAGDQCWSGGSDS